MLSTLFSAQIWLSTRQRAIVNTIVLVVLLLTILSVAGIVFAGPSSTGNACSSC